MIVDDKPYAEMRDIVNVWVFVRGMLTESLHVILSIKHN